MVLKSKTGSEKQKATVQQLKKVLRYVGMRGKKRKKTKIRKSLKKPSNQIESGVRSKKKKNKQKNSKKKVRRRTERRRQQQRGGKFQRASLMLFSYTMINCRYGLAI